ncbi:bacteriochlorophyll 4-vinyl reductase [Alexandriicola marinus]|uniref:bacteriochlorophyll 4-vinyl reductase n=1 Tax=Alexandriicola marinus TaxID=2081710 RepID=UPI0023EA6804|nr:bacteriochlorophyll 4-vinyl reductase [Alexandriicola marinus]
MGPNAILQLLPHLEERFGASGTREMLDLAGVAQIPDGQSMIPEEQAARLHRVMRIRAPEAAPDLALLSGTGTADYILAHRIPRVAQTILKALPPPLAARALTAAIGKHAWTFAGSGRFEAKGPWCFEIHDNPLIRGEKSDAPLCTWHAAVFERLYRVLVAPDCRCVETCCRAQPGQDRCRFELRRA